MASTTGSTTKNAYRSVQIVAVAGALSMASASHAGPLLTYQHFVGDPNNAGDEALGVLELTSFPDDFLTTGLRRENDPSFRELQLVTRHGPDGSSAWSFAADWFTRDQFALEAIELPNDELAIVGISRESRSFNPGFNPDERITLTVVSAFDGGLQFASRYPGGSLSPGSSFDIPDLEAQAAIVEAPPLFASALGGEPTRPGLAVASLNRTAQGDPFDGQFLRIDGNGLIESLVRYREPASFNANSFALFDLEALSTNDGFIMVGRAARRIPDSSFDVSPIVLIVDLVGGPASALLYPILGPEPNLSANSSVATAIVLGAENEAYIAGYSDFYRPGVGREGAFVMRIDLSNGGSPDWIRVIGNFSPGVRSLSLNADGALALCGTFQGGGPGTATFEPALIVLDASDGSMVAAMQYEPSGGGRVHDAIARTAGGWLLAGSGRPSGFSSMLPPIGGSRGVGFDLTDMLLIRTDGAAATGCHETPIDPVSELIQVDPIAFQPQVNTPALDPFFEQIDPFPVEMAVIDDCVNVPCPCFGDADGSQFVTFADITAVLGNWLAFYGAGDTGPGDANCDSNVNFADITTVLGNWLKNCIDD